MLPLLDAVIEQVLTADLRRRMAAYQQEIDRLVRRNLTRQAQDLVRIRREFSRLMQNTLRTLPARYRLNQATVNAFLAELAQEIDKWQREVGGVLRAGMSAQEELSAAIVRAYGEAFLPPALRVGYVRLDPRLLNLATDFSARLIAIREGGLGSRMQAAVDRELRAAVLATEEGAHVTAGRIVDALHGVRRFHWEAERIYRTEVLRVQSMATEQAIQALNQRTETHKRWQWSGIEREEHARITGQTVTANGKFRVPLRTGGHFLMRYPRDPAAPAHATINCGCFHYPVPRRAVELAQDMGISLRAAA